MECASCGTGNESAARFCKKCGTALVQIEEVSVMEMEASAAPVAPPSAAPVAAKQATSSHLTAGLKKESGLRAGSLEIHGKVINYGGTLLSINNIEKVMTHVPQPPFPTASLALLLIGLIALFVMPPAGILLLLLGIVWIALWFRKRSKMPKGITFCLVSGSRMTVYFSDHELAGKVMDALETAISNEDVQMVFQLPADASMKEEGPAGSGLAGLLGK